MLDCPVNRTIELGSKEFAGSKRIQRAAQFLVITDRALAMTPHAFSPFPSKDHNIQYSRFSLEESCRIHVLKTETDISNQFKSLNLEKGCITR